MQEKPVDLAHFPVLRTVRDARQQMEKRFTTLSGLSWVAFDDRGLNQTLEDDNLQERPYAYEFYHQMRKLRERPDAANLGLNELAIQAEVNKSHQNIPHLRKMPDFLSRRVNSDERLAVFEFKVTRRLEELNDDIFKLINFRHILLYRYGVEVIIGRTPEPAAVSTLLDHMGNSNPWGAIYNSFIVYFDVNTWTAMIRQRAYPG